MAYTLDRKGKQIRDYQSFLRDFWGIISSDDSINAKEDGIVKSSNINGVTWDDIDFAVGILHSMGLTGVSHEQAGSYAVTDPREVHSTLFLGPVTENTKFGDYTDGSEEFDSFLEELFVVLKDSETELEEKEHIIAQSADENGVSDDDKDFALCLLSSADNENITYHNTANAGIGEDEFDEDEDIEVGEPLVISSPRKRKKALPLLNPELVIATSHSVASEGRIIFGGAAAIEDVDDVLSTDEDEIKPSRVIGYPDVRAAEEEEELPDGYSDIFWAEVERVEAVLSDPKKTLNDTLKKTAESITEKAPNEKQASQIMWAGAALAFGTTVTVVAFFIKRAINKRS